MASLTSPFLAMMMVAMRMIGVASGVRRRGYRGKGDGRRQKHRQENFLHRFFLLRDPSRPKLGRETPYRIYEVV